MIELHRSSSGANGSSLAIKVVGLGGAGANALDRIQLDGLDQAELIAVNTDAQALAASVAPMKIQLGRNTTRGLGAGGDPEIGFAAAEEAMDEVKSALEGAGMVVICAGLGGGTGSGAGPLIANYARRQNALVVAFVTLPFSFEGRRRMAQAEEALSSLAQQADLVVCFENDRMGDAVSPRAGIQEAFAAADQTISQSIRAIAAMLQRRGLIHVGFDELATALRGVEARAIFGYGEADGDNRAHAALERALRSPLMDRGKLLADAESVLVHIAGGPSTTLNEVTVLMEELNRHISDTTRLLFSTSVDQRLGQRISVTLLSSLSATASVAAPVRETPERVVQTSVHRIEVPAEAEPEPVTERTEVHALVDDPVPLEPEPELVESNRVITAPPAYLPPVTRPGVPPPPAPVGDDLSSPAGARAGKPNGKPKTAREEKQEQMTFEPVTRGRFEKSEPTIIDGQDLDVPAFMRMNVRVK